MRRLMVLAIGMLMALNACMTMGVYENGVYYSTPFVGAYTVEVANNTSCSLAVKIAGITSREITIGAGQSTTINFLNRGSHEVLGVLRGGSQCQGMTQKNINVGLGRFGEVIIFSTSDFRH